MKPGHVFTIEPMICEGECHTPLGVLVETKKSGLSAAWLPKDSSSLRVCICMHRGLAG